MQTLVSLPLKRLVTLTAGHSVITIDDHDRMHTVNTNSVDSTGRDTAWTAYSFNCSLPVFSNDDERPDDRDSEISIDGARASVQEGMVPVGLPLSADTHLSELK